MKKTREWRPVGIVNRDSSLEADQPSPGPQQTDRDTARSNGLSVGPNGTVSAAHLELSHLGGKQSVHPARRGE